MKKTSIFIASSTRAQPLALQLKERLRFHGKDKADLRLWWDNILTLGKTTLLGLTDECQKSDFAIVLLTEDDVLVKKDTEHLSPRDNCIFELGLFTGALGPDPERVFLITSTKKGALPSDVDGITYVPIIDQRVPGSDDELTDDCKDSLDDAARKIINQVNKLRHYLRPVLPLVSDKDLMDLETIKAKEGNLLANSHVIVSTEQPIELEEADFAGRVQGNMKEAIRYFYFFYADQNSFHVIAQLIQALATCGIEVTGAFHERRKAIETGQEIVKENLKRMQQYLNIHFSVHKPAFQLCLHNAERSNAAICYLRFETGDSASFVDWAQGNSAKRVADHFIRQRKKPKNPADQYIFRSTADLDLDEQSEFKTDLSHAILQLFPASLEETVRTACFGQ
jgi:hypothetical protein